MNIFPIDSLDDSALTPSRDSKEVFEINALQHVGRVHELRAPNGSAGHAAFAAALLGGWPGEAPVLWVSAAPDWYPPGLAWLGLDAGRCIFAQAKDDAQVLGALELGLLGGMAGVGEAVGLSRLAARRLALAARQGGGLGFLLRFAPRRTPLDSTAFYSRWFIAPAPGGRLKAELLYAKGGQPGEFYLDREGKNGGTAAARDLLARAG
jgi:protein ImuA